MKSQLFICLLILGGIYNIEAQRNLIKIDKDLRTHSVKMKIKIKDLGKMAKFEFGPYKQISVEKGWENISLKEPFFGSSSEFKSSQKQHFVFIETGADTIIANIDIKTFVKIESNNFIFRELFEMDNSWVEKGFTLYNANLFYKKTNTTWNLYAVNQEKVDNEGEIERDYNAKDNVTLSNGKMIIRIKPITKYEKGKSFINSVIFGLNFPIGYEFFKGDKSVAALRLYPLKHMYFMAHNDLDNEMKFILAASATTLCSRFLKYIDEMDD